MKVPAHPAAFRIGRRGCLLGCLSVGVASALGRTPQSGVLRLAVPWDVARLDPHDPFDAGAELFGPAIVDRLYDVDARGRPYPALAAALPERLGAYTQVRLRPGLVTAQRKALTAKDVLWSLERSRAGMGRPLLAPLGKPSGDPRDALSLLFPQTDPEALALVLSRPATAIVPRGFSPQKPDGTGAFQATLTPQRLLLLKNPYAARGPAFLERVEVRYAADLSDALRTFEVGDVDVGWLGRGLHQPRSNTLPFSAKRLGWAVLRAGRDAKSWSAPGVVQSLLDGIAAAELTPLGLSELPAAPNPGSSGWQGPKGEVLVDRRASHLVQIATSLAELLSRPGHELSVRGVDRAELGERRARQDYLLLLDFVRELGPDPRHTLLALLAAVDPMLTERPPLGASPDARSLARTLSLGVVGALGIAGAHLPKHHGLETWQLGAVWADS